MTPWLLGARPRTLPAAVVPVLVGTASAAPNVAGVVWWRAAAALVVAPLAVRLGDQRTRWLYVTLLAAGTTAPLNMARAVPRVLVALLALPLAVRAGARVLRGARGADLVPVLGETGRLQLLFGVLLATGLWLG